MKNYFLHGLAKLCLIAYALLAHSYTAQGQNSHLTEYDSLMPYTTSGRLLERSTLALSSGGAWYNPQLQSGRYDTICRPSTFGHLLQMMYEAGYGYSIPPIASDSVYSIYRQTAFVPPTTTNGLPTRNAQLVLGVLDMDYDHLTPYAYDSACLRFDSATGSYMVSSGWVHVYDTVFLDTLTWSTHPDSNGPLG